MIWHPYRSIEGMQAGTPAPAAGCCCRLGSSAAAGLSGTELDPPLVNEQVMYRLQGNGMKVPVCRPADQIIRAERHHPPKPALTWSPRCRRCRLTTRLSKMLCCAAEDVRIEQVDGACV